MNSSLLKIILFSLVLILLIDSIYLSTLGSYLYSRDVYQIQGSPLRLRMSGAIGAYLFIALVLNYFILIPNKSPFDAFILGMCIYGIFDFTNLAIFKNYTLQTALVDTIWGGILFMFVTKIFNFYY